MNRCRWCSVHSINEGEASKILKDMITSSAGWDYIRPYIVKKTYDYFTVSLRHMSNLSFSYGVFPDEFKTAKVIPLLKRSKSKYKWIKKLSCVWLFLHLLNSMLSKAISVYSRGPVIARLNTLRPRQYCHHFADDNFKCIFMDESALILIIRFRWCLFLRSELTIFQHWFR